MATHDHSDVQMLPTRGAQWYLSRLIAGRTKMTRILALNGLGSEPRRVLDLLLTKLETVERRWSEVDEFCSRFPRTLVHSDFSPKNLRVRQGTAGLALLPLDWESAGLGSPAADLSEELDFDTYCRTVREAWPHIDREQWQRLRTFGRAFRIITAIDWAAESLATSSSGRTLDYLATYDAWLGKNLRDESWSVLA